MEEVLASQEGLCSLEFVTLETTLLILFTFSDISSTLFILRIELCHWVCGKVEYFLICVYIFKYLTSLLHNCDKVRTQSVIYGSTFYTVTFFKLLSML
jgi:hypothetical protein